MLQLSEVQHHVRNAMVAGDVTGLTGMLVGGPDPKHRLAIHQRHYRASLVTALLSKFPATDWLLGHGSAERASAEFVRQHPPSAPCIAEYGESFPEFISVQPYTEHVEYLRAFSQLEWHIGQVSISVDQPALSDALSQFEPADLLDATVGLQPGLRYMAASQPVDELMKLYLSETSPNEYFLAPADVRLEIRGSRGNFSMSRLDPAEFTFRRALLNGRSIGLAAEEAIEADSTFDPGRSLVQIVAERLVTTIARSDLEQQT